MSPRRLAVVTHRPAARFALAFPPIVLDGDDATTASAIAALGGRARGGRRRDRRSGAARGSCTSVRAGYDIDLATATVETVVEPRSFSRETEHDDEDTTLIDWADDRAEIAANRAEWERRRERLRRA